MKTENQRIVAWNEERDLIKTPNDLVIENDMSYVIEEVIESMTHLNSKEARPFARLISDAIRNGNVKKLGELIQANRLDTDKGEEYLEILDPEQIVDACADIKVFTTGTIRKTGYEPDIVMDEVITQIDSRTGKIVDGKFTKDDSEEAQSKWYVADLGKALL